MPLKHLLINYYNMWINTISGLQLVQLVKSLIAFLKKKKGKVSGSCIRELLSKADAISWNSLKKKKKEKKNQYY